MNVKLDYFEGLARNVNKKFGYNLRVLVENDQYTICSNGKRVYGTTNPVNLESAFKSMQKDGTISHYLFSERKEYKQFIENYVKEHQGANPKVAHKAYFLALL